MKIILVTSDLTYAPENYNDVFEYVISNASQHLAGIVIVKINKISCYRASEKGRPRFLPEHIQEVKKMVKSGELF